MALSIKNPEADRLVRELCARTGEGITEAVIVSLRERLQRQAGRVRRPDLREDLEAIRRRCAALPVLDPRTPEEILGYGADGMPG
jgi:antitoxin VapB